MPALMANFLSVSEVSQFCLPYTLSSSVNRFNNNLDLQVFAYYSWLWKVCFRSVLFKTVFVVLCEAGTTESLLNNASLCFDIVRMVKVEFVPLFLGAFIM